MPFVFSDRRIDDLPRGWRKKTESGTSPVGSGP